MTENPYRTGPARSGPYDGVLQHPCPTCCAGVGEKCFSVDHPRPGVDARVRIKKLPCVKRLVLRQDSRSGADD